MRNQSGKQPLLAEGKKEEIQQIEMLELVIKSLEEQAKKAVLLQNELYNAGIKISSSVEFREKIHSFLNYQIQLMDQISAFIVLLTHNQDLEQNAKWIAKVSGVLLNACLIVPEKDRGGLFGRAQPSVFYQELSKMTPKDLKEESKSEEVVLYKKYQVKLAQLQKDIEKFQEKFLQNQRKKPLV